MKEITEALYFIKYKQLLEEVSEILKKLDIISEEQGLDIFNPEYGLEEHYINIQKIINEKYIHNPVINNEITEPLQFKSKLDLTYAEKIKSNILKIVETNLPANIEDVNERTERRLELIRRWAGEIIKVTGHNIRTAQDVLKGNQDIYADIILIMEDILPVDRDDILGRRKIGSVGEFEHVLANLRKYMNKNRDLAEDIEKIINALLRLLGRVSERNYGDFSSEITPCLEKCFDEFRQNK
jgi:hypothetical protein